MKSHKLQETNFFKTIESVSPDEHVMVVVYQHPFGIIFIYAATLFCLAIALISSSLLLPDLYGGDTGKAYTLLMVIAIGISILVGVLLMVATVVYRQSKLTVTDRTIVQVLQKGLLIRKVSQLSLANVEDVTSEQQGIFASIFNYGTLKIETAGEQANFTFSFCPNPHRVAKIILDSKDDFLRNTGQTGSYRNQIHSSEPVV